MMNLIEDFTPLLHKTDIEFICLHEENGDVVSFEFKKPAGIRSLSKNRARCAGMRLQADQGSRSEVVAPVLHQGFDNEELHSNRLRSYGL